MTSLPAHGSFLVRARRHRVSTPLLGVVALALLASCGAGGEAGAEIVTQGPDGEAGASGGGSVGGGSPTLGENCVGLSCELEAGGDPVVAPPGCGDGVLTSDEACDDGNQISGDGCAEHCLQTEPGFSCASPGEPCRSIARCGDGVVAATEQCDDQNVESGDGCSARCRVELGKKCEGEPSVCTDAICGNGIQEGAEACDDGNTTPFDGCSPLCLKEPNCDGGTSCTSECGDGLLINEECDDGNLIDGDGCSSSCTRETGFECVAEAACELVADQCVLRAPAIFRDFGDSHPDFGEQNDCTTLAPGAVAETLDQDRRPVLNAGSAAVGAACLSTPENFAQWYRSGDHNVTVVGEILLFDNGRGGYVNRFGAEGQQFEGVDPETENAGGVSLAACEQTCANQAQNATQCANECRPISDEAEQLQNGQLIQLTNQLNQAQNAAVPDEALIAELEADIAEVEADIAEFTAQAAACLTDCETERETLTATCAATCKPCSYNPQQFCIGGEVLTFDGNPLFFPVDSVTQGPTVDLAPARVPDQYGYTGFPSEATLFPGAPEHNFYFTSEVQYWFKYDADTQAQLDFLGDDDVWVFINGRLAVDLGGIHVPSYGTVTIDAAAGTVQSSIQDGRIVNDEVAPPILTNATTADFGLVEGNVYTINIFQAERKQEGSSFQLTLAGFEATPSECTAICGDGVLSFGEECDDGVNDGGYGECGPGCVLGPFCGDGIQQAEFGESCDVGPGGSNTCRGCRQLQIQ